MRSSISPILRPIPRSISTWSRSMLSSEKQNQFREYLVVEARSHSGIE